MNLDPYLTLALDAAEAAAGVILSERDGLKIWQKEDGSPITSADLASNEIINEKLSSTGIKILSEEKILGPKERADLEYFWLIDPLDGTKGFLRGGDEFCVMISLIHHARPVLALIKNPCNGDIFYAHKDSPVYKNHQILEKNPHVFTQNKRTALLSVNHLCKDDEEFAQKYQLKALNISSGLKFTALLDGRAGLYRRKEKLSIWDLAAGDFLVNQNGGFMGNFQKRPLCYNEDLRADFFIAVSDEAFLDDFEL
ncbi:inositol monophosphatase family protein [Campylobacter sp.]|uniref:3'(2'),5'-bisphosphate nucleotidase CysQ n=1 Tax=Campylobacter sp. TaxID=205 RepID=UPI0026DBE2C7|nr:inositol monophosphatase family protein [Campylobacter sp.]MDO4674181.1 inositol monophosphatase family protein [Campylobacter sp.]